MTFSNAYGDAERAKAYATVEFPGSYYLAYRDLPSIISRHVSGDSALDFGCGAGRSSRFLKKLGFDVVGIDISENMVEIARSADEAGSYHIVQEGDFGVLGSERFDLILCCMPFDNIPDASNRTKLLHDLGGFLAETGRVIIVSSTRECYLHEFASLSSKDFPENATAHSGDPVKIVMKDGQDQRPITDFAWTREDYSQMAQEAGLREIEYQLPLGKANEPFNWISETFVAPFFVCVLEKQGTKAD